LIIIDNNLIFHSLKYLLFIEFFIFHKYLIQKICFDCKITIFVLEKNTHIHNLERSYFFFYGYAIACCINMLFAWQIENSGNTHLAVKSSTVSSWCFYSSGFNYKADNFRKYSEKDRTLLFSKDITKMSRLYVGVTWQKSLCGITETAQPHISGTHYSKDSKNVEGFSSITEFPDKLS